MKYSKFNKDKECLIKMNQDSFKRTRRIDLFNRFMEEDMKLSELVEHCVETAIEGTMEDLWSYSPHMEGPYINPSLAHGSVPPYERNIGLGAVILHQYGLNSWQKRDIDSTLYLIRIAKKKKDKVTVHVSTTVQNKLYRYMNTLNCIALGDIPLAIKIFNTPYNYKLDNYTIDQKVYSLVDLTDKIEDIKKLGL